MSGYSTGVRGGVDAQAQALGVARLKELDEAAATELLQGLRAHMGGRDGVLRILHTRSEDKSVKFKSAGVFKRAFISSDRRSKAGEAVEHLMRKAGYTDDALKQFNDYRTRRGDRGVEVREVLRHLNRGKPISGPTAERALAAFGADLPQGARTLGAGGAGAVKAIRYLGEPAVYKVMHSVDDQGKPVPRPQLSLAPIVRDRRGSMDSDLGEPFDRNPAQQRPRLARTGDVLPNWMKDDIKHVIRPLAYVIRETGASGEVPVFHIVPAGKVFKNWATDQLTRHADRSFEVEGTIQPRAPGRQLLSEAQLEAVARGARTSGARRYDETQLRTIARSGFEAIESAARHGFVFGDIKPENIMTDGTECKFIDLDALQKVSKQGGETVLNQYSHAYLLPVAFHRARTDEAYRAGVERDLYALGMTLVETALRSARRHDLATQVLSVAVGSLTDPQAKQNYKLHETGGNERAWLNARAIPEDRRTIDEANTVREGSPLMNTIRARLGDYPVPPGSAIAFGLECIRVALEYDSRGQSKAYDPATAEETHPLRQLALHPVVAPAGAA